jgi:hypothetical protein
MRVLYFESVSEYLKNNEAIVKTTTGIPIKNNRKNPKCSQELIAEKLFEK